MQRGMQRDTTQNGNGNAGVFGGNDVRATVTGSEPGPLTGFDSNDISGTAH